MRNGAVLIRYQNLEAKVLQVVISRLVGNLRGVGHIDVGPAADNIGVTELDLRAVGVPLEPLVVGVAVAVQVFYIFFQIVDHVFTVEGLTGIQHIVISLHAVGDAIDHHALIVGDHADDVGPAADGDGLAQRVVGVAGQVIIPAAVVVPALEHIVLAGRSTLSVVVRDIQARNTNGIADFVIPHYRNRCIGCGGIAVAIDHDLNSLGLSLKGVGIRLCGCTKYSRRHFLIPLAIDKALVGYHAGRRSQSAAAGLIPLTVLAFQLDVGDNIVSRTIFPGTIYHLEGDLLLIFVGNLVFIRIHRVDCGNGDRSGYHAVQLSGVFR